MTDERIYVVDRVEEAHLVLVGDDGSEVVLATRELPLQVGEGTVLRVLMDGGNPAWATARPDALELARRLDSARKKMDELRKDDPGGDVDL